MRPRLLWISGDDSAGASPAVAPVGFAPVPLGDVPPAAPDVGVDGALGGAAIDARAPRPLSCYTVPADEAIYGAPGPGFADGPS